MGNGLMAQPSERKPIAKNRVDPRSVAFAKLYDRKTPLTAADLMDDRVVPFLHEHEIAVAP